MCDCVVLHLARKHVSSAFEEDFMFQMRLSHSRCYILLAQFFSSYGKPVLCNIILKEYDTIKTDVAISVLKLCLSS